MAFRGCSVFCQTPLPGSTPRDLKRVWGDHVLVSGFAPLLGRSTQSKVRKQDPNSRLCLRKLGERLRGIQFPPSRRQHHSTIISPSISRGRRAIEEGFILPLPAHPFIHIVVYPSGVSINSEDQGNPIVTGTQQPFFAASMCVAPHWTYCCLLPTEFL